MKKDLNPPGKLKTEDQKDPENCKLQRDQKASQNTGEIDGFSRKEASVKDQTNG